MSRQRGEGVRPRLWHVLSWHASVLRMSFARINLLQHVSVFFFTTAGCHMPWRGASACEGSTVRAGANHACHSPPHWLHHGRTCIMRKCNDVGIYLLAVWPGAALGAG